MNGIQFLKTALKNYKTIGAITQSSRFVAERVCKKLGAAKHIIEYGAGDGILTKKILKHLPADGKIIAVERDAAFLPELMSIPDFRLIVLHEDVVETSKHLSNLGLPTIDAVVSGIPFTFLEENVRDAVVRATYDALGKNGVFVLYQCSRLMLPVLERYFKATRTYREIRNIPPYFIMCAYK